MTGSGDCGILTTDTDLVVRSWDDWLASATSIGSDRAAGQPLAEVVPSLARRALLDRFRETLATGVVQVFSPGLHGPMFPCALRAPAAHFDVMQQRVTVGPLLDGERIAGLVITVHDVTPQLDAERALAAALAAGDPKERQAAADAIAAAARIESLDSFAPALRSDDWRVRRATVSSLAAAADHDMLREVISTLRREHRDFAAVSSALKLLAITDVDITSQLAELLHDDDADLRTQAALALGQQHHPAAVPPLLAALEDPDANVRFHAIEALGHLRADAAVDALATIAESGDLFLGFAAVEALARIRDHRVTSRLLPLLAQPALRDAVAGALRELGDERTLEPLVRSIDDAPEAAPAIIPAIAALGERLAAEAVDASAIVRNAFSDAGRRHLLALAEAAAPEVRIAAARVMGWIGGTAALAALGRLLHDDDARETALEGLVRHEEAAVDVLIGALAADDPAIRHAAITGLGRIGSHKAIASLVPLLDDPESAIATSGALARIGNPEAFEPLFRLAGHPDAASRLAAIGALNSIGHPDLPARALALLDHPDPRLRESAVRIAGYFGYPAASDRVVALTSDPVEPVRLAALEQLPFFDDARALGILAAALVEGTPGVRAVAVRAVARLATDDAPALLASALADEDPWVRYYAARGMGGLGDRADVRALAAAAVGDAAAPVRIAAIEAIPPGADAASAGALFRCAADPEPDVAVAALAALGRLGSSAALQALKTAVRDGDTRQRAAAVRGLGEHPALEATHDLEWLAAAGTDPGVTVAAIEALERRAAGTGPAAAHAVESLIKLLSEASLGDRIVAAVARVPSLHLPRLVAGLAHPHPAARCRAVEAIARARRAEATRLLERAFDDEDPRVREAAVAAIVRLGTRAFEGALRALAAGDASRAVRRAAADALAALRNVT
jgi:HEAT repeat protein